MGENTTETTAAAQPLNAMTVDVEDYYQVSAFDNRVDRQQWHSYPQRVVQNTGKLLQLFDRHQVSATFFTLGWVAEKYPELIREIVAGGHDLASHGWNHIMVTRLDRQQFREDIRKAKDTLEAVSGQRITGYRAPSYSINRSNQWAHDILAEEGYLYSSSIAPVRHTLYGFPGAPRFRHRRAGGALVELPITTVRVAGRNLPCGGGGWFRLYPYWLSKMAIKRVNTAENQSAIFYIHPWELDPQQPRINNIGTVTRFRHYQNLHRTESRLEQLLRDFRWNTMPATFSLDTH